MIHPDITPESLRVLGQEWGANLIRWQLIRYGEVARLRTFAEYDDWLEGELRKLEQALPHCEKYGLRVALDLHSPPGGKPTVSGYAGSDAGLFTSRAAQDLQIKLNISDALAASDGPSPLMTAHTLRKLETMLIESKAEYVRLVTLLDRLKNLGVELGPEGLAQAITTAAPDPVLSSLLEQLTMAEQSLVPLEKVYGPEHAEVLKSKAMAEDLHVKIKNRVSGVMLLLTERGKENETEQASRQYHSALVSPFGDRAKHVCCRSEVRNCSTGPHGASRPGAEAAGVQGAGCP